MTSYKVLIVFIQLYFCWIINFSCEFPQIVYHRLNYCFKMVLNYLNIFLRCEIGNFIPQNFNLRTVFLHKFLVLIIVGYELFFNFHKVFWLIFKLFKQNLFFNLLVFRFISLQIFSVLHCLFPNNYCQLYKLISFIGLFLKKFFHAYNLSLCCFSGLLADSYEMSRYHFLTHKASNIFLVNLRQIWLQNEVIWKFILADFTGLNDNIISEARQVFFTFLSRNFTAFKLNKMAIDFGIIVKKLVLQSHGDIRIFIICKLYQSFAL